ncbi:MAG: 16S rRNA (uracil(1498)-N(3))-methyltransferase [Bdellovibrionales bacterium]|nr:16S rRNA (uracil(1498)-N(3))-methyltransferase [Bdellovibrionales bacterium]
MRAVFHDFHAIEKGETLQVTGEAAHHLNVVRVRPNETILLLNGKGARLIGVIDSIQKNLVEVKVSTYETTSPQHELSLAIANPKKDAFEDILKAAVELGIRNIYPLSSEFSQYDYIPSERVDRIIENALVQSNNAFWPVIHSQLTLKDFLTSHNDTIVFFNSKLSNDARESQKENLQKTILIGPEGGFSPAEVAVISAYSKTIEIHLPTPIMRAPTAVSASVGYLLATLK